MATDWEIKKMHKEKLDRMEKSGSGAQIGGLMHDASTLLAAGLKPNDLNEETVKQWVNRLLKIAKSFQPEQKIRTEVDQIKAYDIPPLEPPLPVVDIAEVE